MQPKALLAWWMALTVVGAAVAAAPDDDRRLFSLTQDHGPSAADAVGMAMVLVGFGLHLGALVLARRRLRWPDAALALAAYVPGSALTAWSVATDSGWWWTGGVAAALAAQAWLAWRFAWRPSRQAPRRTPAAG